MERELLEQCKEIAIEEQDFDSVYTDGSFDINTKRAGIAAVIVRKEKGELIYLSKHLAHCESSTEAEVQAIYFGLILMKKYRAIRTLKTDSAAAIACIENRSLGRKLINETFRFWMKEIRNQINEIGAIELKWIRGHSNILGNEIADTIAKEALALRNNHEEVISEPDANYFFLWKENRKIDFCTRSYLRKLNLERRNNDLEQISGRFNELRSHLEPSEYKEWVTMLQSPLGARAGTLS